MLDMQDEMEIVSAVYMVALTGGQEYHEVIRRNFSLTAPFYDTYLFLQFSHQGDALLYYTTLPGADADVKNAVLAQRRKQGNGLDVYQDQPKADLYMAYMPAVCYTWGSNNARAALGSANMDFAAYHLARLVQERDRVGQKSPAGVRSRRPQFLVQRKQKGYRHAAPAEMLFELERGLSRELLGNHQRLSYSCLYSSI
jgi:hypothetical protein